ncbi:MAG: DUF445 family protein, partial [Spirochaetaceae bacterium]|nr:DUF445 family protein [Spirochaetaceae bacterium]
IFSSLAIHKNTAKEAVNKFFAGRAYGDIFSEGIIKQIKININEIVNKNDFSLPAEELARELDPLIDNAIKKLEERVSEMTISEFIGTARTRDLQNYIADFMESADGKELLRRLIEALIDAITNEKPETNLAGLLKPDIIRNAGYFIERNTPVFIDKLISFINKSRAEIDQLINEAAKQHFKKNDETSSSVKNFVFTAIAKNGGFTDKIIRILEKNRINAGEKFSLKLKTYLENTSAGDLISRIKNEKSETLKAENIAHAVSGGLREIQLENYPTFTTLMNTSIKSIIPNINLSFIKTKLIYGKLKKIICDKSNSMTLQEKQEKINEIIDAFMRQKAAGISNSGINENTFRKIIFRQWDRGIDAGTFTADKSGEVQWEQILASVKKHKINDICRRLRTEKLYDKAAETVQTLITDNLNTILGGNVFDIAKNELSALTPSQVNKVVQAFMGTQLKPINIIGAILGGIAGAATVFITYILKTPENFTWPLLIFYGVIFAIVGIATNWVAIKMLFHPYKKTLGINFPPFVGVASCKQAEFAGGIANLIRKNMLNEESLSRFYAGKKDELLSTCKKRLSSENYKFIDDFFSDDTRCAAFTDSVLNFLRDYITKSSAELTEHIDKYIMKRLEADGAENLAEQIRDILLQKLAGGDLAEHIGRKLQENVEGKTINEIPYISESLVFLYRCCLRDALDTEKIAAFAKRQEAAFSNYIKNNTLNDLSEKENIDNFFARLTEKIPEAAKKAASAAADILSKKRIYRNQSIEDCFGGITTALISRARRVKLVYKLIAGQKNAIVDSVMNNAGGNSFFGQIVKQAANALMRKDVEAVAGIVIDEKLFPFLNKHGDDIFDMINSALEVPFGFDSEIFNKDKIETELCRLSSGGLFLSSAKNFLSVFLERAASEKLEKTLSFVNAGTLSGLLERLNTTLAPLMPEISAWAAGSEAETALKKPVSVVLSAFKNTPSASLLRGIDAGTEIKKISIQFFGSEAVLSSAKQIIGGAARKILSDKDFYNHTLFREDLSNFMINCVEKEKYAGFHEALERYLSELFSKANTLTAPAVKDALFGDYFLPALLRAGENHFPGLANSLSLYDAVEREIKMMPPKEIEEMFYSFAGSYFKKIIFYGWIGLFGGLLSYALSCFAPRLISWTFPH